MIHQLKIYPWALEELIAGNKTYEIRKDDRKFSVGDVLFFPLASEQMPDIEPKAYEVTHILTWRTFPDAIKRGYVILSLRPVPVTF